MIISPQWEVKFPSHLKLPYLLPMTLTLYVLEYGTLFSQSFQWNQLTKPLAPSASHLYGHRDGCRLLPLNLPIGKRGCSHSSRTLLEHIWQQDMKPQRLGLGI